MAPVIFRTGLSCTVFIRGGDSMMFELLLFYGLLSVAVGIGVAYSVYAYKQSSKRSKHRQDARMVIP